MPERRRRAGVHAVADCSACVDTLEVRVWFSLSLLWLMLLLVCVSSDLLLLRLLWIILLLLCAVFVLVDVAVVVVVSGGCGDCGVCGCGGGGVWGK